MKLHNLIDTLVEYGIINRDDAILDGLEKIQVFMGKLEGKLVIDAEELNLS